MTSMVRRAAVTLGVAVGSLAMTCAPAGAAFAASAPLPAISISTATLQPPTGVGAVLSSCSNGRWMSVSVSWTASSSSRVTGYDVQAHRSDGSTVDVAQVAASTTAVSTTVDKLASGSTTVTFTVIAQLNGWTAESASSGPVTC